MGNISSKSTITLREITSKTVLKVCQLTPSEDQKQFVASNAVSIAEAHFQPHYAWFRAIYADETPIGFVMIRIDSRKNFCFLWRFMIDKQYQKNGFGRRALELLFIHLKSETKVSSVVTSYHKGKGDPSGFYKKLGFAETDGDWGDLSQQMREFGEIGLEIRL